MHAIDIVIPTFDNYQFLAQCLQSILRNKPAENLFHIWVVNNGHKESCDWINNKNVTVLQSGKNLGWEGALKYALRETKAPYVLFLNDDTLIPQASRFWLNKMIQHFLDPKVGAVGPASNVVMGFQNIFNDTDQTVFLTKFLIGFCMLVRRSALEEVGGVDDSLPGGDDLDLSIRLRKAEYKLVCDKNVFVYHHGFKTGTRVRGEAQQKNGWNSYEMLHKTNTALIQKHGFAEWWDCTKGAFTLSKSEAVEYLTDSEGDLIRERIKGDMILDLGCGGNKTVPEAIGVDMIYKDEAIATLSGTPSSADVNADVSEELPFDDESVDTIVARHIFEHLIDSVTVLRQWGRLLRHGGRLIIAVPNNEIANYIPLNIEHVHGFSKDSIKSLMEATGFKVIEQLDGGNGISFITVGEKL
jgi:GT2 family glycosyltransferase/SAM-dependent methyltransferase